MDQKILDRIRKLLAKGESAKECSTEEEAATFLGAAYRLMEKHNISMTDIEFQKELETDPVKMHVVDPNNLGFDRKKRAVQWQLSLMGVIAEHHHCDIIMIEKSNKYFLIGRRQHRVVAEYVFMILVNTVITLSQKMYVKRFYEARDAGNVEDARGYKQTFINAFVVRIHERYEDEQRQLDMEYSAAQRATAVVRMSTEKGLIQQIIDAVMQLPGSTPNAEMPKGRKFEINHQAIEDGRAAADAAKLRQNGLKGGDTTQPSKLGQGQRLLSSGT